jgi:hypothetical protein
LSTGFAGKRRVIKALEDVSCKMQDFGPQDIIDKIPGIKKVLKKSLFRRRGIRGGDSLQA